MAAFTLPWAAKPVILDVRLPGSAIAIPGALRLSPYKLIDSNTIFSLIRKAAFAFFAVPGTERDPEWITKMRAAVPLGTEIIVACERGGSLETRPGTMYGFSSRSLKAIHFLRLAGYSNVCHLSGGMYEWCRTPGLTTLDAADE